MLLRAALLAALALGLALEASAQITLRADQTVPYQLGANTVTQYDTANDDGASTAAIDALVAQSGPNQTWDFSGLASETVEVTAVVTAGDTGPGQGVAPYDQATRTYELLLPPQTDEDGNVVEGTVHGYYRLDGDGLHNLGVVVVSRFQGQVFEVALARLPGGSLDAVPEYTFGSTWESTFVEAGDFLGETNKRVTYHVDGWGTLVAPGGVSAPALRVKVTDLDLDDGGQDVTYEFRTAGRIAASLEPDDSGFGLPPTASLSTVSAGGSTSSGGGPGDGVGVGAPWPNPARASAALEVTAPRAGPVRVAVYDLLGRQAAAPVAQTAAAGASRIDLDTQALPAGVYLVRVEVGGRTFARSLTVVR